MLQGDKSKWLDPNLSTLGNPSNSYTSKGAHPVIYDYVWYRSAKEKTISVTNYQVTCQKVVDWSIDHLVIFLCRFHISPLEEKRMSA